MSKLVVSQFVSLDGVMEAPGGDNDFDLGAWTFEFDRGPEGDEFKLDEVMASDSLLLGRITYEGFANAWPKMQGDFADKFNGMPKHVVSTTLTDPEWSNSTVIAGDVAAEVAKLKEGTGGDILVNGSCTLCQTLIEEDLVDEYRLMLFPVILGHGFRLFRDDKGTRRLKLTDSMPVGPDGVIVLTYEPA